MVLWKCIGCLVSNFPWLSKPRIWPGMLRDNVKKVIAMESKKLLVNMILLITVLTLISYFVISFQYTYMSRHHEKVILPYLASFACFVVLLLFFF